MNQLTVGQRIDVYEVVKDIDLWEHSEQISNAHFLEVGKDSFDVELYLRRPYGATTLHFPIKGTRKCGYYLKVKSLKGGNNES